MADETPRYAVQGTSDRRRIELPARCELAGAVRHAVEHAGETGQSVLVEADEGDGWVVVKTVGYPFPPRPHEVMLAHYSRALDEIYRMRVVAAGTAQLLATVQDYATLPKGAARTIRRAPANLCDAAQGRAVEVLAETRSESRKAALRAAGADECLTRGQWEGSGG